MSGPGTTQQHALDILREAIVDGTLRPGERVHQEDLAERVGVSVVPIREALRTLEGEGQVTYRPRRGYFVTELNLDDLAEIYDLRQLLEGRVARAALVALDDDQLERIEAAAAECAEAADRGDVAATLAANRRFHFALLDTPSQQHGLRLIRLLWDSTEAYRALYYNRPEQRAATIDHHDEILDAIRERDPARLVAALDAHRNAALQALAGVLGEAA